MTTNDLSTRNAKANGLRVFQAGQGQYYVENSQGKICYKVFINNGTKSCTCGDFTSNGQKDPQFACKHILAVVNCNGGGLKAEFLQNESLRLDERFIKNIEGRDFVLYSGLLDLAHQKGLLKIEVEPLQFPTKENGNFAICKASAFSRNGETFVDVGDANPTNCNAKVAKHLLRMASTRAKARALRDMDDIGMTCLEELGDLEDALEEESVKTRPKPRKEPKEQPKGKPVETKGENEKPEPAEKKDPPEKGPEGPKETVGAAGTGKNQKSGSGEQPKASTAQIRAIEKLAERRGISSEDLTKRCQEMFGTLMAGITTADASSFIRSLQQSA